MNYCPKLCSHTRLFILRMQHCLKAEESGEIGRCSFTDADDIKDVRQSSF